MKKLLSFCVAVLFCVAVSPVMALAMSASGSWSGTDGLVQQSGTVNFNFPATGGAVSGTYSGTGNKISFQFGGNFSGNFEGCWGGKMSGTFTGWYSYVDVFTDELESRIAGGDWSGTLNEDGTITASFGGMSAGSVRASYNTAVMERECGPVGEAEEPLAKALATYAYVIVDGEKRTVDKEIDAKIDLLPGMTIGVEHDNGLVTVDIGGGNEILLMGAGTEVTVLTADQVDKSTWKDIVGMQPAGSVVTMSPGKVIVRYSTPDGEEKYWIPDSMKDDIDPNVDFGPRGYEFRVEGATKSTDMSIISFITKGEGGFEPLGTTYRGCLADTGYRTPWMPEGWEDCAPEDEKGNEGGVWNFFFGNKSEVFYDYDGKNVYIEVNQGEVEIWRSDFAGNAVLVATVLEGKNYKLNMAKYNKSVLKDGAVGGISDETLLYGGIGAAVLILAGLIIFFVKKKK